MTHERIGKYRIIAKLGQGGMARVLLTMAEGPHGFNKLLVVKELKDDLAHDPEFLIMFLDEARIAARLNHPNIVQTYEVGSEGDRYWIAMEYLEGQPLNAVFRRIGRKNIPLEIHLRILADVLAGLEHAHKLTDFDGSPLEIVHRDISPQNIFVTYEGQVKVVDFGIAKAAGASTTTKEGILKGKISYIAPEQARCEPVDRRADLFAVGVMLWEAVAGRRLVQKEDEMSILARRMSGKDPHVIEAVPDIPAEIAAMCDRAMGAVPEERFQSAREFREVLERYLAQSDFRVSSKEVGQLVTDAFDDERVRIRGILEDQLKNIDKASGPISIELHPVSMQATSDSLPRVHPGVNAFPSEPPSANLHYTQLSQAVPNDPRGRSMVPAIAAAAAALAAVVGVGVLIARSNNAAPSNAGRAATATTATTADAATISLKIAYPAGATMKLDNGSVEGNPFHRALPRDGSMHQIEVSQDGFVTEVKTVTFDRDIDMSIDLAEEAKPDATDKPKVGRPWRPAVKPTPTATATAATPPPTATEEPKKHTPTPSVTIDEDNPYKKKAP